jgi:hypothetical protein
MDVQPDFRDLLALLNEHRVEYLITSLSAVSWEEAETSKEAGSSGDVPVFYIGRRQYIANKRAAGRMKDLADIEALSED